MDEPLVSAVITAHNRKELLLKAIDSVLNQTYKNIELIVVDDASTDGTPDVLPKMAQECGFSYIYIDKSESKGGNHARNIGIKQASGEWVAFLDDDDEWMPEKIQLQIEEAGRTGFGLIGCERTILYASGEIKNGPSDLPTGDLSMAILTGSPYTTSMLLVKRSLLLEVGCFDESITHWQDYELEIRLCQRTKVACVRQPLVLYRRFLTDKARLTNQLEKWEIAVASIEAKHAMLLGNAPEKIRKAWRGMVARDGARRAVTIGDKSRARQYLWQVFMCERNPIWPLKVVLGRCKRRKPKLSK